MALLKTIILDNGVTAVDAYHRIESINGNKDKIEIKLVAYLSQSHFLSGKSYLTGNFFSFTPSIEEGSPNFFKQGYEFVKSTSEFQGAIDILEEGQTL